MRMSFSSGESAAGAFPFFDFCLLYLLSFSGIPISVMCDFGGWSYSLIFYASLSLCLLVFFPLRDFLFNFLAKFSKILKISYLFSIRALLLTYKLFPCSDNIQFHCCMNPISSPTSLQILIMVSLVVVVLFSLFSYFIFAFIVSFTFLYLCLSYWRLFSNVLLICGHQLTFDKALKTVQSSGHAV